MAGGGSGFSIVGGSRFSKKTTGKGKEKQVDGAIANSSGQRRDDGSAAGQRAAQDATSADQRVAAARAGRRAAADAAPLNGPPGNDTERSRSLIQLIYSSLKCDGNCCLVKLCCC